MNKYFLMFSFLAATSVVGAMQKASQVETFCTTLAPYLAAILKGEDLNQDMLVEPCSMSEKGVMKQAYVATMLGMIKVTAIQIISGEEAGKIIYTCEVPCTAHGNLIIHKTTVENGSDKLFIKFKAIHEKTPKLPIGVMFSPESFPISSSYHQG